LSRLADLSDEVFVARSASRTCSTGTWSSTSLRRLARRGLDRPPRFAWTWFSVSPRRLAWWGLSRSPRLTNLLGEELVIRLATPTCSTNGPKRSYGPYLGYLPWYPKHSKSSNLSPRSLSQLSHRYHKGWLGLSSLASSVIIYACKLYPYLNINHTENIGYYT
jgi:hypothetical protein